MNIRLLIVLCTVSIISWLLCVGLIGRERGSFAKYDEDARRYLKKAIPKVAADWNYNQWRVRAASELIISTNQKKVKKDFANYRDSLGKLKRMEEPYGNIDYQDVYGERIMIGTYTCRLIYANSTADVAVKLVRRGGGWKFQGFAVRSEMIE
ncbi:MAG TPA: hypothetical protein VEX38_02695 [Fimbriimonadaceae bacterium]|nr:hypothetical protein [Fimbriimonadaceae bacterium]